MDGSNEALVLRQYVAVDQVGDRTFYAGQLDVGDQLRGAEGVVFLGGQKLSD